MDLFPDLELPELDQQIELTVIKQNEVGEETWRYSGVRLHQDSRSVILEAFFDREDFTFHGIFLGKGDRFVEIYFNDRWYNIFEIHAREDDHLRGWYCNIATPVNINQETISYRDLALDLLVYPDGQQLVLDEDEFLVRVTDPHLRNQARQALTELQEFFNSQLDTSS
jgi:protein associated with RNAse G/E